MNNPQSIIIPYSSEDIAKIIHYEISDDMCADQKVSIILNKLKNWRSAFAFYKNTKHPLNSPEEHSVFLENIQALISAAKVELAKLKSHGTKH